MKVSSTVDTQAFAEKKQLGETNRMLRTFEADESGTGKSPLCESQREGERLGTLSANG